MGKGEVIENLGLSPIDLSADLSAEIYQSPDCQDLIRAYRDFYKQVPFQPPWVGYFIKNEVAVLGSCGFTGPPMAEAVEIAYWTFPAFEGRGVASFACRELIKMARKARPAITITAKTAPLKNASVSILEKNGFILKGVTQDHEIGEAWFWVQEPENSGDR